MKVTILGCGGSLGVPMVGNQWGTVDRQNPKNRRRRPSILIEKAGARVLVDTGPDLREQLLDSETDHIDAVLFTHDHADHVAGLDDLRALTWATKAPVPGFAAAKTAAEIRNRYAYAVANVDFDRGLYKPIVDLTDIAPGTVEIEIPGTELTVTSFEQTHGPGISLGLRVGDFAYSTDVSAFNDAAWQSLEGVNCWILDATRREPHPSHAHLALSLEWIERLRPERAILTHMNHTMDYQQLCDELPQGVEPAYDGMVLEIGD